MRHSHEVLKKAVEEMGVKEIAAKLNLSTALIYKWCEASGTELATQPSGARNPLDRVRDFYQQTGNLEIVHWICEMADGFYVKNCDPGTEIIQDNLLENVQVLIKEFSETLYSISSSFDMENRITEEEAKKIRKEWEDLKRVGESLVHACEQGKFDSSK